MIIQSIGHQGWLISNKEHNVLIDPLLLGRIGSSNFIYAELNNKKICLEDIKSVSLIIFTVHHLDHFDVNSLEIIVKKFPSALAIIHNKIPKIVIKIIEENGLNFKIFNVNKSFELYGFSFEFLYSFNEIFPWERSSTSLLITNESNTIYIQAEGSPEALKNKSEKEISLFILTNNSQLRNNRRVGFFSNMLLDSNHRSPIDSYISSLTEIKRYIINIPAIIFTGTDFFIKIYDFDNPIFFDSLHNENVEWALQQLSNGIPCFLAHSLQCWDVSSNGIELIPQFIPDSSDENYIIGNDLIIDDNLNINEIVDMLNYYRISLLISSLGRMLLNCHVFNGECLSSERLAIVLMDENKKFNTISFDINTANFKISSKHLDISNIPFFLKVPEKLFFLMLKGIIGPWELSFHPEIEQSFIGSESNSILSFFAFSLCPTVSAKNFLSKYINS